MLQSALFSDSQMAGVERRQASGLVILHGLSTRKVGFARLVAWGRALVIDADGQGMSAHLRRDIGMEGLI